MYDTPANVSAVRCYAQRMLSPYRGLMQVVATAGGEAVSIDGVEWGLYLDDHDLQAADGGETEDCQVMDIRYGRWSARDGLRRAPLLSTMNLAAIHQAGSQLVAALEQLAHRVPFPLADQFELWLLDASTDQPLALLDSRCRMPAPVPASGSGCPAMPGAGPSMHPAATARTDRPGERAPGGQAVPGLPPTGCRPGEWPPGSWWTRGGPGAARRGRSSGRSGCPSPGSLPSLRRPPPADRGHPGTAPIPRRRCSRPRRRRWPPPASVPGTGSTCAGRNTAPQTRWPVCRTSPYSKHRRPGRLLRAPAVAR